MYASINVSEKLPGFADSLRFATQLAGEEMEIPRARVRSIFGAIPGLVVRVLEGMARIRVNLHIHGFAKLLHGGIFFNDTASTEIYTLSLHDALPIFTAASL